MTTGKSKTISVGGTNDLHVSEHEPLGWFEDLYAASTADGQGVPWATMSTHPLFAGWLESHALDGRGRSALVVGCGMGDDAIRLEELGFDVTAFDVSDSAINYCKARFPDSRARFVQADLFQPPSEWSGKFDFVLEIYTVQAVPPVHEPTAIGNIAEFVAVSGDLLVIAEVEAGERSFDNGPPWPLTPGHVESFASRGLKVVERRVGEAGENGRASYTTLFRR
ncbi:MAG: class I SAM-dependent methyltransferase [Myxococcales bacterium FL481]|nr:MAG: class I SAM-dependent methyltransferase [Myxococcales bacterium FL481]